MYSRSAESLFWSAVAPELKLQKKKDKCILFW